MGQAPKRTPRPKIWPGGISVGGDLCSRSIVLVLLLPLCCCFASVAEAASAVVAAAPAVNVITVAILDSLSRKFTFYAGGMEAPSPMMRKSLVYNLYKSGRENGVTANPKLFEEVYTNLESNRSPNAPCEISRWPA